jgi:hypothetical protein
MPVSIKLDPFSGQPIRPGDLTLRTPQARVLAEDADGVVVPAGGRLLAVLGLDDVIVVDTPDAVLVTTRQHAQEVPEAARDPARAEFSGLARTATGPLRGEHNPFTRLQLDIR